jgi:hypothetical protein
MSKTCGFYLCLEQAGLFSAPVVTLGHSSLTLSNPIDHAVPPLELGKTEPKL